LSEEAGTLIGNVNAGDNLRNYIQNVPKVNGKTSGIDSPYREAKRKRKYDNMCPEIYVLKSIQVTSYIIMQLTVLSDLLVTLEQSDTPNTVALNTPVTSAVTLGSIQAHIKFIRNLIACVTIVQSVSQFIPAIRTCRRALSKYTLGQLCNNTIPDPRCHALFFFSLYEESIPEVLPLSFDTPCIHTST
jgi:hypothetical protein